MGRIPKADDQYAQMLDLISRVEALERSRGFPVYTVATIPDPTPAPTIIFVEDGSPGNQYLGSNGISWVSLG